MKKKISITEESQFTEAREGQDYRELHRTDYDGHYNCKYCNMK